MARSRCLDSSVSQLKTFATEWIPRIMSFKHVFKRPKDTRWHGKCAIRICACWTSHNSMPFRPVHSKPKRLYLKALIRMPVQEHLICTAFEGEARGTARLSASREEGNFFDLNAINKEIKKAERKQASKKASKQASQPASQPASHSTIFGH